MRVQINPEMFRWARERAGKTIVELTHKFPKLMYWETGEVFPTLKQLENFAKATYLPVGYLFLQDPPEEIIPIPDFRTMGNRYIGQPSPDLLDTVYMCQQRQEWYRNYIRSQGEDRLHFIGSVDMNSDIFSVAAEIRNVIDFNLEERRHYSTWTEALRQFISKVDDIGIMVMVSGVAGSNNRRKLLPDEFRGFVFSDEFAPLVFINGADTKAAQMFTLAHELAHLWLGESALSDLSVILSASNDVELWCNKVAAEILVPLSSIQQEFQPNSDPYHEINRLARIYKVSTLVIIRRIFDAECISREEFHDVFNNEVERLRTITGGSGGNYYLTQAARVSKRFARALIGSTLEGQTLYRDAQKMLGFKKYSTFQELGRNLGVL